MHPDVTWIEDPAFGQAFDALVGPEEKIMAAHTNKIDPVTGRDITATYPGFINIRFEGGRAILTVRGDPEFVEATETRSEHVRSADTVELTLEQGDWDQFVSEATRERGLVPGG